MFDSFDDSEVNFWDEAEKMANEAFEDYERGHMESAFTKLSGALELSPEHEEWYFNTALTLDGMEKYEKAIDYYLKALERSPEDVEILNCLAVDFTRTTQYDRAIETFELIEKLHPAFEPAYCNRIIAYTEMELHDKAEQMFYLAQQLNPDCPICFYNIGNSLFTRGHYERAIWCWNKCAELDPGHPQIHYRLAQAYWVSGQAQLAREEFLTEIRQNPTNLEILLDFGLFLLECGQMDSAREKFNRILEFDASFAAAKFYLGEVCRMQNQADQALRWYREALEDNQRQVGPRFRIAEICLARGDCKLARELLQIEFRLGTEDVDILQAMGWMFLQLGASGEASNCFIQVLEQDSFSSKTFFGLGISLAQRKEYKGALHCLKHSIRLNRDNRQLLLSAGWVCYQLKKWPQALAYTLKCLSIHPPQQPYLSICRQLKRAVLFQITAEKLRKLFKK